MSTNQILLTVVAVLYLASLVPFFWKMCKYQKEAPNTLAFILGIFIILFWPLLYVVLIPLAYLGERFKSPARKRQEALNKALDEIIRKGREDLDL